MWKIPNIHLRINLTQFFTIDHFIDSNLPRLRFCPSYHQNHNASLKPSFFVRQRPFVTRRGDYLSSPRHLNEHCAQCFALFLNSAKPTLWYLLIACLKPRSHFNLVLLLIDSNVLYCTTAFLQRIADWVLRQAFDLIQWYGTPRDSLTFLTCYQSFID